MKKKEKKDRNENERKEREEGEEKSNYYVVARLELISLD